MFKLFKKPLTVPPELRAGVRAVAASIAPDLEDGVEDLDNESLVEACLDADRLDPASGLGGTAEAHAAYRALLAAGHSFTDIVRAVSREVRIV